ncbi:MAG: ATP-binding protein [Burkholderiales bacterium]|jgi:GTPase SAR1 family protein|nr:ATP-binding protein [Burkholderiales bacterium]
MNSSCCDLGDGRDALERLLKNMEESENLNEADTRHRFVDCLIHECLGWDRACTRLERSFQGEYTDYELGTPPQVVIEAKRSEITFEIPNEKSKSLVRSVKSLIGASKNFDRAFKQVVSYCQERGIQIGVVANSFQLVMFLAVRTDGIPVFEGKCLVFNGHKSLKDHFSKLWEVLSPDGCENKNLLKELTLSSYGGIPPKLSSYIVGYPNYRYPKDIHNEFRILSELLIDDVPDTPVLRKRFLSECYCESGALSKDALLGKDIIAARYSAMFPPERENPSLESISSPKQKNLSNQYGFPSTVVADALGHRPIVIIGDVGVGKTSFIRHLVYVKAADEMQEAIFLYIDLGQKATLEQNIKEFLVKDIQRQLLEDHDVNIEEERMVRGVYHGELLRFEKGIYGPLKEKNHEKYFEEELKYLNGLMKDRVQHLKASLQHISKARRKQVIICIDNVDQREQKDQEQAFLAAQEFAASWSALVLISIRPRTYFASKSSGSISAYPQRILTVSPPRIDLVLEKRLQFSLNVAEGRVPIERLKSITMNLDSIAVFLKALINSLKSNRELTELLVNITGGNIREAVELIKGFMGSANVDSEKIIRIMREDKSGYVIPLHEFTKQALLGSFSHYDAKSSLAYNLFDLIYPNEREHFLCSILISFLISDCPKKNQEGFIETSTILSEMQRCGYVRDQVEHALRRLTNKKLIETTERLTFNEGLQGLIGDLPLSFRVTTIGAYHIKRWAPSFPYMDAMVFDTPILNEDVRNIFLEKANSFDIKDRYKRTKAFDEYLKKSWDAIENPPSYFNWPTIRAMGEESFASVKKHIESFSK